MARCQVCGKIGRFGNNVSHSNRHTSRRWLPNVHRATFHLNGEPVRLSACTRCIRSQYKGTRVKSTG